jgi:WD40 repeat protein
LVAEGRGRVFVWDVDNSQLVQFIDQASTLNGMTLNDDGTQVAIGIDNQVRLWDVATGNVLLTLPGIDPDTIDVSEIVWKREILAANVGTAFSTRVYTWNTNTGQLISVIDTQEIFDSIDISPDGTLLIYSTFGVGTINVRPIENPLCQNDCNSSAQKFRVECRAEIRN